MPTDAKRRSVTKNDIGDVKSSPVIHFMLAGMTGSDAGLPMHWSPPRDFVLRRSIFMESMWASAIHIAITKMAALQWTITGPPRQRTRFQELLLEADANQSWTAFLSKHLRDYLTTDNGAFIEVVHATQGAGSKIIGLFHLDSVRCTRTGDPDIPILYRDKKNVQHEMRAHQVLTLSDMPDPDELYWGVGYCAASRAWKSILKLSAIEQYITDKASGQRPLSIYIVNGVSDTQLMDSLRTAREDAIRQGYVNYMGAVIISKISDVEPKVIEIPLAKLPDGFDRKEEFNIAMITYARAIGLDVQDLQPLQGRMAGTAAQSEVLHDKSLGQNMSMWRQQFTHNYNQFILPEKTTFAFNEKDVRDQMQRAQLAATRATAVRALVGTTTGETPIISPQQAVRVLIDQEELPKDFMPNYAESMGDISDVEKPGTGDVEGEITSTDQPSAIGGAAKEKRPTPFDPTRLLTESMADALRIVRRARKPEKTATGNGNGHHT